MRCATHATGKTAVFSSVIGKTDFVHVCTYTYTYESSVSLVAFYALRLVNTARISVSASVNISVIPNQYQTNTKCIKEERGNMQS